MRKGFSLLTAIIVIVLMSAVAAMVFSISGKVVRETTAQYRKEQAILLAKSYTEYAILAIQGQGANQDPCLTTIRSRINATQLGVTNANGAVNGEGYLATIQLHYIGPNPMPINCLATDYTFSTSDNLSVLIDVDIRYKDLSQIDAGVANTAAPEVHYRRRTLQRL